jgi:hypothetical protein
MKRKFVDGARVSGKDDGPGSFRSRQGTIVSYFGRSEYLVRFDDGREEYARSHWLEAANN